MLQPSRDARLDDRSARLDLNIASLVCDIRHRGERRRQARATAASRSSGPEISSAMSGLLPTSSCRIVRSSPMAWIADRLGQKGSEDALRGIRDAFLHIADRRLDLLGQSAHLPRGTRSHAMRQALARTPPSAPRAWPRSACDRRFALFEPLSKLRRRGSASTAPAASSTANVSSAMSQRARCAPKSIKKRAAGTALKLAPLRAAIVSGSRPPDLRQLDDLLEPLLRRAVDLAGQVTDEIWRGSCIPRIRLVDRQRPTPPAARTAARCPSSSIRPAEPAAQAACAWPAASRTRRE